MRAPDFYPDKSEGGDSRFVQIVAKPGRKAEPKLTRVAFETSRLMEFCSLRELQNQTGHAWSDWPLVVLKELVDNALDACEESEIAPVISVGVEPGSITIADNGRGIEASTIKGILDYSIRVPSREAYVSPHLTLRGEAFGKVFVNLDATDPAWVKWKPRNPTSAHWYNEARLQRYLAAHVAWDRKRGQHRTVRDFISEFRGLSRSAVQREVLQEVGCSHQSLEQFFGVNEVNRKNIAKLLAAMRKHTKPVAPKHLGVIGQEHFRRLFLESGGNEDTFKYEQRKGTTEESISYIVEFAFGLHERGLKEETSVGRKFITGANWSVGIVNPFRTFGATGEGLEKHPGEGSRQRFRAGDCGPASCVGACAIRRSRKILDHFDRRRQRGGI
jgi:hypothetical protein